MPKAFRIEATAIYLGRSILFLSFNGLSYYARFSALIYTRYTKRIIMRSCVRLRYQNDINSRTLHTAHGVGPVNPMSVVY